MMEKVTIDRKLRSLVVAFSYPFLMVILAFIPEVNRWLYSGHGIGWFPLYASLTWVGVIFLIDVFRQPIHERKERVKFALWSILSYMIVSYPLSFFAETFLTSIIGGERTGAFWYAMTFPMSKLLYLIIG